MNAEHRPGILERHLDVARRFGRAAPDRSSRKLETAGRSGDRNVKRLAIEFIHNRACGALDDPGNLNPGRPAYQVNFELDGKKQRVEKLRAHRSKNREVITQWFTRFAGNDGLECSPLRLIRPFVNDNLSLAVSF